MKHFPSTRGPARFAGLDEQLTQQDGHVPLTLLEFGLVVAAVFALGFAAGAVASGWADLHGRRVAEDALQPSSLEARR